MSSGWPHWVEWRPLWRETEPSRAYLRCEPTPFVVVDVMTSPEADRGHWRVMLANQGGTRMGVSATIEQAKQEALEAVPALILDALEQFERRLEGIRAEPSEETE